MVDSEEDIQRGEAPHGKFAAQADCIYTNPCYDESYYIPEHLE